MKDPPSALQSYAERMVDMDVKEVEHLITGMVEGLVRVRAARMNMMDLFADREKFKKEIEDEVRPFVRCILSPAHARAALRMRCQPRRQCVEAKDALGQGDKALSGRGCPASDPPMSFFLSFRD